MTHSRRLTGAAGAAGTALMMLLIAQPAQAIDCQGRYQVVGGNLISTPYCEDNYLGKVARGYGVRKSNGEIRNNPNSKSDVCRSVGHDSRVRDICSGHRDEGGRNYR